MGLCIGSFLNVCIDRIPKGENIIYPSSHCDKCGYRLKFFDLIPVVSFLYLRGKCKKCRCKISLQNPIIEMLNGVLYLIFYIKYDLSIIFFKCSILTSFLIVVIIICLKRK